MKHRLLVTDMFKLSELCHAFAEAISASNFYFVTSNRSNLGTHLYNLACCARRESIQGPITITDCDVELSHYELSLLAELCLNKSHSCVREGKPEESIYLSSLAHTLNCLCG